MSLDVTDPEPVPDRPLTQAEEYRALVVYLMVWCPWGHMNYVRDRLARIDAMPHVEVRIVRSEAVPMNTPPTDAEIARATRDEKRELRRVTRIGPDDV